MTVAELWRRGQVGWPRSFPLAQFPNPPLLVAFAGLGLGALADGAIHDAGRWLFVVGLGVWAWQETTAGVNWFRRVIGVCGLIWVLVTVARRL